MLTSGILKIVRETKTFRWEQKVHVMADKALPSCIIFHPWSIEQSFIFNFYDYVFISNRMKHKQVYLKKVRLLLL